MYRGSAIALGILAAAVLAACSDTPTGSKNSPQAGAGGSGIGRFSDDSDTKNAVVAPPVEKGVVPDVIGVAAADGEAVIEEAGFKVEIEGGGVFGLTADPSLLICTQDPAGGETPKKNSVVTIEGQRSCD